MLGFQYLKRAGCGNQLARYHRLSSKERIIYCGDEEWVILTVTSLYFYISYSTNNICILGPKLS